MQKTALSTDAPHKTENPLTMMHLPQSSAVKYLPVIIGRTAVRCSKRMTFF